MIQCRIQFVCETNIPVRHTLQRVWACTLTRILKESVYSKRDLRYARPTPSQHCTHRADLHANADSDGVVHHKPQVLVSRFYRTFTLMAFSIRLYRHTSGLLRFISSPITALFAVPYRDTMGNYFSFGQ